MTDSGSPLNRESAEDMRDRLRRAVEAGAVIGQSTTACRSYALIAVQPEPCSRLNSDACTIVGRSE